MDDEEDDDEDEEEEEDDDDDGGFWVEVFPVAMSRPKIARWKIRKAVSGWLAATAPPAWYTRAKEKLPCCRTWPPM